MNPIVRSEVQFCSWQWSVVCAGGGVVPRRLVGGDSDENVTGEVWRCCCCWTRHSSALLYSKLDRVRDVDVGNARGERRSTRFTLNMRCQNDVFCAHKRYVKTVQSRERSKISFR